MSPRTSCGRTTRSNEGLVEARVALSLKKESDFGMKFAGRSRVMWKVTRHDLGRIVWLF